MFAATLPSEPNCLEGARTAESGLQRSAGSAELVISASGGIATAYQNGSAKLRFPKRRPGQKPEAVLINLSGGLTGGDCFAFRARVEDTASLSVTSQACERIYRSLGLDAVIDVSLEIGRGASLDYLPQSTILFDGGRLKRETRFDLAEDATLLAVESVVFGRTESGERVDTGAISDSCRIRRGGRLIHADRFVASGKICDILQRQTNLDGHRALATLRYVAPDSCERLEDVRNILGGAKGIAAASAWDGMMMIRFVAPDGYTLNHDLGLAVNFLRGAGSPRMWLL